MTSERVHFSGAGCSLSALEYGDADNPALIIVHGMRDHAHAMAPLVEEFRHDYHVIVPDLRGHGDSENPGVYAMAQLVADLRALYRHFSLERAILVGHSLGGHIVTRYTGTFPASVSQLVIVDGMGPPRTDEGLSESDRQQRWQEAIDSLLGDVGERRAMADVDEAISRLARNNPKLSPARAGLIATEGVEPHPGGGVRWKWDPRIQMVWNTFDHGETEQMCGFVRCPVLVVTGEHSMDYWTRMRAFDVPDLKALHDAENRRRVRLFPDARHLEIPDAGHMIHYDQPALLGQAIRSFLED